MIGTRGPDNIAVLEPKGIPVKDVAEELLLRKYLGGLGRRFNISNEEIIECAMHFLDTNDFTSVDFVEFLCEEDKTGELNITTVRVSDLVFIASVIQGVIHTPEENSINVLYTNGIAEIVRAILSDISEGSTDYEASELHYIIFKGLTQAYGEIDNVEADILLLKMESYERK